MMDLSILPSITPLLGDIMEKASACRISTVSPGLSRWFAPRPAGELAKVCGAIRTLLMPSTALSATACNIQEVSTVAAFFLVALFAAVRKLMAASLGSNPTWVPRQFSNDALLDPEDAVIAEQFHLEVNALASYLKARGRSDQGVDPADFHVALADSARMPASDHSIDAVISSPPYCTRLDYAISSLPELAVLGLDNDQYVRKLRERMLGTPTVSRQAPDLQREWGRLCLNTIKSIREHASVASSTYYTKYFMQYFTGLYCSLVEIGRCLRRGGVAVLVVQDSYYKDVHVDLPGIVAEMGGGIGLASVRASEFCGLPIHCSD